MTKELEQEVAQLKARVMELEEALVIAAETLLCLDEHTHPSIECDAAHTSAMNIYTRQPPQSLEAHDREVAARALDKARYELPKYDSCYEKRPDGWLIHEDDLALMAAKLRAGGEKG